MKIFQAQLPEDLPIWQRLMTDYLLEFDPASDPAITWDDEYYALCSAGVSAGTHTLLLAREGDNVVGFALLRLERMWYRSSLQLGHFEEVYVQPGFRRQDVGRRLVVAGREWFHEHQVHTVAASVIAQNAAALPFWQRIGFEIRVHQMFRE